MHKIILVIWIKINTRNLSFSFTKSFQKYFPLCKLRSCAVYSLSHTQKKKKKYDWHILLLLSGKNKCEFRFFQYVLFISLYFIHFSILSFARSLFSSFSFSLPFLSFSRLLPPFFYHSLSNPPLFYRSFSTPPRISLLLSLLLPFLSHKQDSSIFWYTLDPP